jgi:hypothetical protein
MSQPISIQDTEKSKDAATYIKYFMVKYTK